VRFRFFLYIGDKVFERKRFLFETAVGAETDGYRTFVFFFLSDDEDVRRFALRAYRFDFAFHIAFVDVCVCAYAFFGERERIVFQFQ